MKKKPTTLEEAAKSMAAGINAYYTDLESYNEYASLIYDLYEACYIHKPSEYSSLFINFGKPVLVNKEKYKQIKACNEFLKNMIDHSPDFDELFEFGSFIKFMEKVFFYKNDKNAYVCCDSNIEDKTTRNIIFQSRSNDVKIETRLTRDINGNTIVLNVYREYGKKMINTYKIVDRQVDLRNVSDKTLMNHVVQLMEDMMRDFVYTMIEAILKKDISYISSIGGGALRYCPKGLDLIDDYYFYHSYPDCTTGPTNEYKIIRKLEKEGEL